MLEKSSAVPHCDRSSLCNSFSYDAIILTNAATDKKNPKLWSQPRLCIQVWSISLPAQSLAKEAADYVHYYISI